MLLRILVSGTNVTHLTESFYDIFFPSSGIKVPNSVYGTLSTASFENKIIHFFNELPKTFKKITLKYVLLFQHSSSTRESSTLRMLSGVTSFLCRPVFSQSGLLHISSPHPSPSCTTLLPCANLLAQPAPLPVQLPNLTPLIISLVLLVPCGCSISMSS